MVMMNDEALLVESKPGALGSGWRPDECTTRR